MKLKRSTTTQQLRWNAAAASVKANHTTMGGKSSTLRPTGGQATPSMAYGRLRIDSPHSIRSPALQRRHSSRRDSRIDGVASTTASIETPFSHGWSEVRYAAERNPLLLDVKTATVGGSIAAERQLSHPQSPSGLMVTFASPPIIVWIGPALLCALAYALYNIFIKKGSASIHPVLGGVILQLVAAILGCALLGFIVVHNGKMVGEESDGLYYDVAGIRWAVCAGLAVGLAEMLSFFVSSLGVQGTVSIWSACAVNRIQ
jgi:uncharacterized membrane protein